MSWHLKNLSLLNWGGYCGSCENVDFEIPLSEGIRRAVCVSGENGSGKTTLTDAYLTLMSPVNVTYNAASNRGDKTGDRRSTWSYVKGAMAKDASHDDEIRYLRPEPIVVSGICGEFATYDGDAFWAAVVMQTGTDSAGNVRRMYVISDEHIDLGLLKGIAGDKIDSKSLRRAYPKATYVFDSGNRYMERLGARLGLGSDFSSVRRATKLLAMVQGEAIPSDVNTVFNQFVFPDTGIKEKATSVIEAIKEANEGQSKLESVYRQMRSLGDLKGAYDRVSDAVSSRTAVSRLIDGDSSPYRLWRYEKGLSWLDGRSAKLVGDLDSIRVEAEAVKRRRGEVSDELQALRQDMDAAKSERISALESQIQVAQTELAEAKAAHAEATGKLRLLEVESRSRSFEIDALESQISSIETDIESRTRALNDIWDSVREFGDEKPDSEESWKALVESVVGVDESEVTAVEDEIADIMVRLRDAKAELDSAKSELTRLSGSKSNMDANLVSARDMIADECGMDPSELPFVAELVDMEAGFDEWRLAANVALGPVLRIMLVDKDHASGFRQVCDRIGSRIGRSVTYREIDLDDESDVDYLRGGICEKLVFDETSDYMWGVRRIVGTCDAVCAKRVEDMQSGVRSVSLTGQIRDARGGRVGYNKRDVNLIGFDNAMLREEAEILVEDCQNDYHMIENELRSANRRKKVLSDRVAFGRHLESAYVWSRDFDIDSLTHEADALRESLASAAESSDTVMASIEEANELVDSSKTHVMSCEISVRDLGIERSRIENEDMSDDTQERRATLSASYDELDDEYARLRGRILQLEDDIKSISDARDKFVCDIDTSELSDADRARFDALFTSADDVDWGHYQSNLSRVERAIADEAAGFSRDIELGVAAYDMYEQNLEPDMQVASLVGLERETYLDTLREHGFDLESLYELDEETGVVRCTEASVIATWTCHYENSLAHLVSEYGDIDDNLQLRGVVLSMANQVSDLYANIKTSQRELMSRVRDINAILKGIYLNDAKTRHIEVRARRRMKAAALDFDDMMKRISDTFASGAISDMDTETLMSVRDLALQFATDVEAELKSTKFVLDPRHNMHIAIIEHDGDIKVTHDNTGQLSGGEVQQMSTCIVGAALLYVMGADVHRGPSYTTLILDEAFSKSDHLRAQTTLKALIGMGFDPVMSMPSDKVMQVSPYIGLGWYVSRGSRRGTSVLSRIGLEDCCREFAA